MFVDFRLGVKAGFTAGAEQVVGMRLHCQQRRRTVGGWNASLFTSELAVQTHGSRRLRRRPARGLFAPLTG